MARAHVADVALAHRRQFGTAQATLGHDEVSPTIDPTGHR